MTVIGLTGGIASGKSVAAEHLRRLGAVIIDADRTGHRSYDPGTPGFEKVVNAFGHDIVGKDGVIDRRVLGGKVFGAPQEMERLNSIVWPEIRRLVKDEIATIRKADRDAIIVLEAAVLIEAGWQDLCDEVWVVTAPPKVVMERLIARNGLSEEAALSRINAQMSARERAEYADVKIDNSGTEDQLRSRVDRAWKALLERRPRPARPATRTTTTRARAARPAAAPKRAATTAKNGAKPKATPGTTASRASRAKTEAARPAASRSKSAAARPKTSTRAAAGRPAASSTRTTRTRAATSRPAARPSAARPSANGRKPAERRPSRAPARRR
jgi:dephospho-CoA kinase